MDNIFFKLNYILTIVYIAWSLTPYFQRNISSTIVLIIVVLWILTFVLGRKTNILLVNKFYILIFVWIIILVLQYLRVYEITAFGNLLSSILFFFPAYMFLNLKEKNFFERNYLKNLFMIITLIILFNSISNILLLMEDPTLSKNMTGAVEIVVTSYYDTNLATLSHMAFVALLIPMWLFYSKKEKFYTKIYFTVLAMVSIIFTYLAGSAITILTVSLAILLMVFFKLKNGYPRLLVMIFSIIFLGILILFSGVIANWLYSISYSISNAFYSSRLQELALIVLGNSTEGSFSLRMYDISLSIKTFFSYPLMGKGLIYHDNLELTGIGMHSQIIDDLGRHGIIGAAFLLYIYYKWFKLYCLTKTNKKVDALVFTIFGTIIFYSLFNIFSNQVYGLLIFFVIPLFVELNRRESGKFEKHVPKNN